MMECAPGARACGLMVRARWWKAAIREPRELLPSTPLSPRWLLLTKQTDRFATTRQGGKATVMDKNLQALFRAKADERGSAKPSVAEMRAMRKAQKQPQPPVAAAPAAAMPPPPPRNPQPMQPPPPRPVHAPASEKGIVEASPVGREVTAEEPAGKRMRVEEPQSVPSTSAPSVAAPAGALPAGFFDNRQLDKKARGVEQPKLDPKCAAAAASAKSWGPTLNFETLLKILLCRLRRCRQEWKLFQESVQEEIQELENKEVEEQVCPRDRPRLQVLTLIVSDGCPPLRHVRSKKRSSGQTSSC